MIVLDGCRTEPLGSYLQGLGAWRALVRVADPDARAHWHRGRLVLTTSVTDPVATLLDRFEPLPVVSPWNAGSGFAGNGKSAEAEKTLAQARASRTPRLARLRTGVAAADAAVARAMAAGWGGGETKLWDDRHKTDVIRLCRAMLPDDALSWLDAAIVLGQDGQGEENVEFNRLLGTGGNFGRQDLQATYLRHALALLDDPRGNRQSKGWLRAALHGDESTPYLREPVGQFDPGRAGGIQSSPGEKSDEKGFSNPWSFLLTIEGTVLFASAVTRRQGARNARAALPFVTRASAVGFGSAAVAENAMAEIWTPEWTRPATLAEVAHLLGEGRADWNGRPARTGLDFVRAVATLGVDRGVHRFTRSVFVERHGQNPLAVPVGVVEVRERAEAGLLAPLDGWLDRLRGSTLPAGVESRLRQVDEAMYEVARAGGAPAVRTLLTAVGRLHDAVARSGAAAERVRAPLGLRQAASWVSALRPDSAELRLAVGLASGRDGGEPLPPAGLRRLFSPVTASAGERRPRWSNRPTPVTTGGGMVRALAEAHRRRALPGLVADPLDDPAGSDPTALRPQPAVTGVFSGFRYGPVAPLADVVALATGQGFDDEVFDGYLRGLLLLDWNTPNAAPTRFPSPPGQPEVVPPALALLLPFYASTPLRVRVSDDDPTDTLVVLRPGPDWLPLLHAGAIDRVVGDAAQRLRIAGVRHVINPHVTDIGLDSDRLAAALLVRLSPADRVAALRLVAALPDTTPSRTPEPEGVPA